MNLPRLTPSEFEIMDAIWNAAEMTVTEVMKQINAFSERALSRSTIQVQIQRLAEKGWLDCQAEAARWTLMRERWQVMSDEERLAASQRIRDRFEAWRISGDVELPELSLD